MKTRWLIGLVVLVLVGCHRTAPQSPSRRNGQGPKADSTVLSMMEVNQRLVTQADKDILRLVDSTQNADGVQFAQMSCGGWKMRRDEASREKALYAPTPKPNEHWRVHVQTYGFDGKLYRDAEGIYAVKHYELPIAAEEAIEDMYEGETSVVYAPWYTAYGPHGNEFIGGHKNVRFVITLKGKE